MSNTIQTLIDRWNTDEGKPYKGELINLGSFNGDSDNANLDCMCAQGQVLHVVGRLSPYDIDELTQESADSEVAKLLNISVAHAILLRKINDSIDGAPSIVLTEPEKVLGDEAKTVLSFWLHLDRMRESDWDATWDVTWDAARDAARAAARAATWDATWDAARAAARDAAWAAAWAACSEIQGAKLLREQGRPFFFLPMFGFDSPDAIPPLPADYGKHPQ